MVTGTIKKVGNDYVRVVNGKEYTVTANDSLGRYDSLAKEYAAQQGGSGSTVSSPVTTNNTGTGTGSIGGNTSSTSVPKTTVPVSYNNAKEITQAQSMAQQIAPAQPATQNPYDNGQQQYYTGGTGKKYVENTATGNIGVNYADGSTKYYMPSDAAYESAKKAMGQDIDAYGRVNTGAGVLDGGNAESVQRFYTQEEIQAMIRDQLGEQQNTSYNPVNTSDYMRDALSYQEALAIASDYLTPYYQTLASQNAEVSAQNLERSGLYDSLYGQALAAQSANNNSAGMQAAISQLAQQMVGQSREEALNLAQLAVQQNQHQADYNQNRLNTGMEYIYKMLNQISNQANADRDYELAAQAQALQEKITNAQISQMEAESQAAYLEAKSTQSRVSSGSSSQSTKYTAAQINAADAMASEAGVNAALLPILRQKFPTLNDNEIIAYYGGTAKNPSITNENEIRDGIQWVNVSGAWIRGDTLEQGIANGIYTIAQNPDGTYSYGVRDASQAYR